MRVATFNIRHGAPPGRRADHRRLRRAVLSLRADVVGLQEVDRRVVRSYFRDQARLVAAATGHVAHFSPARTIGPCGRYGNALLVPPGPTQVRTLELASDGEARVAQFARLRVGDGLVTVVNTHLQNRGGPGIGRAPAQLDAVLDELTRWPGPWVVMGDFNLDAAEVLPRFAAAGLTAVPTEPTFPSTAPRARIDWVGVRGLTVRAAEVPRCDASDHRPIVVDLDRG